MFRETTEYVQDPGRGVDRIRDRGVELARRVTPPQVRGTGLAFLVGTAAFALFAAGYFGPDFLRYMKIRRM